MEHIERIAIEEDLVDTFVHRHATNLFVHCNPTNNHEYIAKTCYWLASTLDLSYEGECEYELISWDKHLSVSENTSLKEEAERKAVSTSLDILMSCHGNLITPDNTFTLISDPDNTKSIGSGSYGEVYLVDGYAVKTAPYKSLGMELSALIRETTALAMIGRLHFIGMNDSYYYIGMEYYPQSIIYETPEVTMSQLLTELKYIHSHNILHCDIKLDNIRIDSNGHARLIDFGCCRFTPAIQESTWIGTASFRDYLLLKCDTTDYSNEIDIWSLGIVFYVLETKKCPWLFETAPISEYSRIIKEQWELAMVGVSDLVKSMLSLNKEDRYTL